MLSTGGSLGLLAGKDKHLLSSLHFLSWEEDQDGSILLTPKLP